MTHIREVRRQHRLTQQQLATAAGITRTALNRIERGHVSPTVTTLYKLAFALGVNPSCLLDDRVDGRTEGDRR